MKVSFYLNFLIFVFAISCDQRGEPDWSVRIDTRGISCNNIDLGLFYSTGLISCSEWNSRGEGSVLEQEFSSCTVLVDESSFNSRVKGKDLNCEVAIDNAGYSFEDFDGEKAVVKFQDNEIELSCNPYSDLNEYDTFENCSAYIGSRFE